MSYRRPGVQSSLSNVSRTNRHQPSYVKAQSGAKRHQWIRTELDGALIANLYFIAELLTFARSAAGGTDDVPLAPTSGSNFQSQDVFNGGKIVNFQATIRIKNKAGIGGYLDVYEVATSFFDVHLWNAFATASCPVTFDSTTVGPADLRGRITLKTATTTLIQDNAINNSKFIQHYIRKVGTIFIASEEANGSEVTINLNRVPPKCRRSQTGMFWGLFFVNPSVKNGGESLTLSASIDESFDEIPTDNRLPFLD